MKETKVSILGQGTKEDKKKIQFVSLIDKKGIRTGIVNTQTPDKWDNIMLLKTDWEHTELDLMVAHDNDGKFFCLFLGHFNDGIV